jgi:hypothetical protein
MIGRADIEGSKSDVAMNAWPPQASYPCGNFSDTSSLKLLRSQRAGGSIGRVFTVCLPTEKPEPASFCPFALPEVSVPGELASGHLRYFLTDVPPQSNSPPGAVLGADRRRRPARKPAVGLLRPRKRETAGTAGRSQRAPGVTILPPHRVSEETHESSGISKTTAETISHLCYTFLVPSQHQTRVKLNRVFFPRRFSQARSLGCGFAR